MSHIEQEYDLRVSGRKTTKNSGRLTMADLKAMNADYHTAKRDNFSFFDRKTSRFFGGDHFYGPYIGPGGIFFSTANAAGVTIREFKRDGSIGRPIRDGFYGVDEARAGAQGLAKGKFTAVKE